MADTIAKKKERIKQETEEIEADISKNKKEDSDAEKKISECTAHFSDVMKKSKEKRKQWHLEVDNIFDHLVP
jgi:Mg2+ and Co2+ transporter CorA